MRELGYDVKSDAQIRQWRYGYAGRKPDHENSVGIERASGGAVSRREFYPDDWHLIWPELMADKSRLRSRPDAARDSEGAEASSYGAALMGGGA